MKFSYLMLYVKDIETSIGFYRDILGLELERTYSEEGGIEVAFLVEKGQRPMLDQPMIELVSGIEGESTAQSGHLIGFTVDSIDRVSALMAKNGYKQLKGPFSPATGYLISEFEGPEGVQIGIMEVDEKHL